MPGRLHCTSRGQVRPCPLLQPCLHIQACAPPPRSTQRVAAELPGWVSARRRWNCKGPRCYERPPGGFLERPPSREPKGPTAPRYCGGHALRS